MSAQTQRNFAVNFSRGFFTPFQSLRLLRDRPRLIQYILIPFLINALVFSGVVYFGLDFFGTTVVELIPDGDAWYWSVLYWLLWALAVLLTAVLVFFSFTVIGNLLASPFNDLLSERVEEVLSGVRNEESFSLRTFLADAIGVVLMEGKKMSIFVVLMFLILPLNLLPGFGNSLYSLLAVCLTLFFLCFEYLGFIMVRKRLFFAAQKKFVFSHKFLMLGFSCGVMALLAVPFLQLLCIPLAVIGATRLWCAEQNLIKDGDYARTDH